mmetsp:Transcript_56356/g.157007  ORF Transcript_56356/g.157007 Transcript_56356/m.157007 type:complete len:252 (+) Transcript_56356:967-1722(+)
MLPIAISSTRSSPRSAERSPGTQRTGGTCAQTTQRSWSHGQHVQNIASVVCSLCFPQPSQFGRRQLLGPPETRAILWPWGQCGPRPPGNAQSAPCSRSRRSTSAHPSLAAVGRTTTAVPLVAGKASRAAPVSKSNSNTSATNSALPLAAAAMSTVMPSLVRRTVAEAPARRSDRAAAIAPAPPSEVSAANKGVAPKASVAWTSAPRAHNSSMIGTALACAATWSGPAPSKTDGARSCNSAPASSNARTTLR